MIQGFTPCAVPQCKSSKVMLEEVGWHVMALMTITDGMNLMCITLYTPTQSHLSFLMFYLLIKLVHKELWSDHSMVLLDKLSFQHPGLVPDILGHHTSSPHQLTGFVVDDVLSLLYQTLLSLGYLAEYFFFMNMDEMIPLDYQFCSSSWTQRTWPLLRG